MIISVCVVVILLLFMIGWVFVVIVFLIVFMVLVFFGFIVILLIFGYIIWYFYKKCVVNLEDIKVLCLL